MKNNKLQTKDIDKLSVLLFLSELSGKWATLHPGYSHSVCNAMPPETPPKLIKSVMGNLVNRGYVDGCTCGCRGDFVLTDKGVEAIKLNTAPVIDDLFDKSNFN